MAAEIQATEIAGGQLFSDDAEKSENYIRPHRTFGQKPSVCIRPMTCNLRCGYCFADTGALWRPPGIDVLRSGQKSPGFLIQSSKHRQHIEVDFFGGEPLLNFDVCKALVAYGKEQGQLHNKIFKFTLTTNGVLLTDEVQQFLNDEGISAVLSLDGRKETNDRMRVFPMARGPTTSSWINSNTSLKHAKARKYYLRGTYTHNNLDFANDVAHMVDELGFRELSMEPVVAEAKYDYALKEEDLPFFVNNMMN